MTPQTANEIISVIVGGDEPSSSPSGASHRLLGPPLNTQALFAGPMRSSPLDHFQSISGCRWVITNCTCPSVCVLSACRLRTYFLRDGLCVVVVVASGQLAPLGHPPPVEARAPASTALLAVPPSRRRRDAPGVPQL